MTYNREAAIQLLTLAASGRGETLEEIANALGMRSSGPVRVARRALADATGAGNWREARAEAAQRLRRSR